MSRAEKGTIYQCIHIHMYLSDTVQIGLVLLAIVALHCNFYIELRIIEKMDETMMHQNI